MSNPTMSIHTVALIGATGALGRPVLEALRQSFTVTALTRKSSKSTYQFPSDVRVIPISDDYPTSELTAAFSAQDAVVSTIGELATPVQHRIVDAAVAAGVQRLIPAEFGANTNDPETIPLAPAVWAPKVELMDYIKTKAAEGAITWTGISTGLFFDWVLWKENVAFLKVDPVQRTAIVFDDGESKFSVTNLAQIGLSVVRVLQRLEETKNKYLFVQSFLTTQNQIVAGLERELGTGKFEVTRVDGRKFLEENSAKTRADPEDVGALHNTIFARIVTSGNNTTFEGYANGLLGLPDEEFESSLKMALEGVKY